MTTRFDPAGVDRYARAIAFDGLHLRPGDRLFVDCEPAHCELVVALGRVCFPEGIDLDVSYAEPHLLRERLLVAPDELVGTDTPWERSRLRASIGPTAAFLWILTEAEP